MIYLQPAFSRLPFFGHIKIRHIKNVINKYTKQIRKEAKIMEVKVKIEKTLHTDNDKVFYNLSQECL